MNTKKVKVNIPNLMERIELGESIRQIAIESGYSYSTLNRYVREQKDLHDAQRGFDKYNTKSLAISAGYSFIVCGDLSIEVGIGDVNLNDELALFLKDKNGASSIKRLDESDQEFHICKDKYTDGYGRVIVNTLKKLVVNIETFQELKFGDYQDIVIVNYRSEISEYAAVISDEDIMNSMKVFIGKDFNVMEAVDKGLRGCYLTNKAKGVKVNILNLLKEAALIPMLKRDGSINNIHIFRIQEKYMNKIKEAVRYEKGDILHADFYETH